jgi:hypothetical protein
VSDKHYQKLNQIYDLNCQPFQLFFQVGDDEQRSANFFERQLTLKLSFVFDDHEYTASSFQEVYNTVIAEITETYVISSFFNRPSGLCHYYGKSSTSLRSSKKRN